MGEQTAVAALEQVLAYFTKTLGYPTDDWMVQCCQQGLDRLKEVEEMLFDEVGEEGVEDD